MWYPYMYLYTQHNAYWWSDDWMFKLLSYYTTTCVMKTLRWCAIWNATQIFSIHINKWSKFTNSYSFNFKWFKRSSLRNDARSEWMRIKFMISAIPLHRESTFEPLLIPLNNDNPRLFIFVFDASLVEDTNRTPVKLLMNICSIRCFNNNRVFFDEFKLYA